MDEPDEAFLDPEELARIDAILNDMLASMHAIEKAFEGDGP